jgi:hypothetical protein
MDFEGKCCLLKSRTVVNANLLDLARRIFIIGAGLSDNSLILEMFRKEKPQWELIGLDWDKARTISERTSLSLQEVSKAFDQAVIGFSRSAQIREKDLAMFNFDPRWEGPLTFSNRYGSPTPFHEPRFRVNTSPSIEDQNKLNKLAGELSRAKMRKDKHLIKQIETKIRDITNGRY